jgi:hypothetical protein
MTIQAAFDEFMANDFEPAVDSATKASWAGSGYSVEFFDKGNYRVLWNQQIGNSYDSPGLILGIPILNNDEWDEDPLIRFYENAREEFNDLFAENKAANLNVQATIAQQAI